MKVFELIALLSQHKAGADVYVNDTNSSAQYPVTGATCEEDGMDDDDFFISFEADEVE